MSEQLQMGAEEPAEKLDATTALGRLLEALDADPTSFKLEASERTKGAIADAREALE